MYYVYGISNIALVLDRRILKCQFVIHFDFSLAFTRADAHRQRIVNWINATSGTSSAFDVTTKVLSHDSLSRFSCPTISFIGNIVYVTSLYLALFAAVMYQAYCEFEIKGSDILSSKFFFFTLSCIVCD